jgi:hypothetical protein
VLAVPASGNDHSCKLSRFSRRLAGRLQPRDKAFATPEFHRGAVQPLLGPDNCIFIILAYEAAKPDEVAVAPDGIDSVFRHYGYAGDRGSEDDSQSLMCDAVSACRAFLRSKSRSMPAGSKLAFSRSRAASFVKRSSKVCVCLVRFRFTETPPRCERVESTAVRKLCLSDGRHKSKSPKVCMSLHDEERLERRCTVPLSEHSGD